jgi:trans-2,3-dihydro-3-hydroxyanthranilate isomerase
MDTRDVSVVDAFAPEPLAGTPVGVVPDGSDLDPNQRSRIADELAPAVTTFVGSDGDVTLAGETGDSPPIHVGLAVATTLDEREALSAGEHPLEFSTGALTVEVAGDGRYRVAVDRPDLRAAEVEEAAVATALGVDVATIRDVAADFPLLRASLGPGVLVVPVNFLEHLSGAEPDLDAVGDVLEASGADSIYAFTFDTLDRDRDAHGLEIDEAGRRQPTGRAEACAAAAIDHHGSLDHDRETLRFEAGDLVERPARLEVAVGESYAVGGPAVTALDGTVLVPVVVGDDDIVEA